MAIELKKIGWLNKNEADAKPINKTNLQQMENNAENAINEVDSKVEDSEAKIQILEQSVSDLDGAVEDLSKDIKTNIQTNVEALTNETHDGKPVYAKKIDLGELPNNTVKNVSIGIDMTTVTVVKMEGVAYRSTDKAVFPLPLVTITAVESIQFFIYQNDIRVITGTDRTNCTGFVIIYYTKN